MASLEKDTSPKSLRDSVINPVLRLIFNWKGPTTNEHHYLHQNCYDNPYKEKDSMYWIKLRYQVIARLTGDPLAEKMLKIIEKGENKNNPRFDILQNCLRKTESHINSQNAKISTKNPSSSDSLKGSKGLPPSHQSTEPISKTRKPTDTEEASVERGPS